MMWFRRTVIAVAAVLLLASTVIAVADEDEPSVEVEVVFSATRTDEKATDVAATVEVVDSKKIEASQATSVLEVLKPITGLSVVQSGSPGGVTSILTRGGNNNQTLVLVDGVRINDPMSGGTDLAHLTVDQVERVEIVKGPFGTLYGADAMAGVVSIFTKPASETPDRISFGGGNYGTLRGSFSVGSGEGDAGFAVSGSWLTTDGLRAKHNEYDGLTAAARWDARVGDGILTLSSRYLDYDLDVPGPTNFPSAYDRQSVTGTINSLTWNRQGATSRDRIRLGRYDQDIDYDYLDFFATPQTSKIEPTYTELSWQHDWIGAATDATLGLEWKRSEGEQR